MTDDESRKAYFDWQVRHYGCHIAWPDARAQDAWQAAVEWATKQERERCAEIVFSELAHFKANGELSVEMPYLEVMLAEIEQEPKL